MSTTIYAVLVLLAPHLDGTSGGTFTVALGGDVSLGRGIGRRAEAHGWDRVLSPLGKALAGADSRVINLETPTGACLPGGTVQRPRVCGAVAGLRALARAGVTAASLANNHAQDAGDAGLASTVAELRRQNVTALGVESARTGTPVPEALGPITVVAANLTRPAWPPGNTVPIPTPDSLATAVRTARERDMTRPVLVILHGGREMAPVPSSFERTYAESAVRAGAAAVVFHGSHTTRALETISGVPVHLGLGNLLFDQRDARAGVGQVLLLRFRPGAAAEVVEIRHVDATTAEPRLPQPRKATSPESPLRPPARDAERARAFPPSGRPATTGRCARHT